MLCFDIGPGTQERKLPDSPTPTPFSEHKSFEVVKRYLAKWLQIGGSLIIVEFVILI